MAAAGQIVAPVILIVGCGDLGSRVGEYLASSDVVLYGLCRSQRVLPENMKMVSGDVTQPATLLSLQNLNPDILLYCVAADNASPEAYQAAYVDGVRNVLQALSHSRLKHVFFVSSTRVYGQSDGEWLDESHPAVPNDVNSQLLLAGEQAARVGNHSSTVLRLSGIYGPGRTRMIRLAQADATTWPANYWTNRIHRDDAAACIAHLVRNVLQGNMLEAEYIVTDAEPATLHEVLSWIKRITLPGSIRPETGKRLSNHRMQQSGFQLQYPTYREGYAALLASPDRSD